MPSKLRLKTTNHKGGRRHFSTSYVLASCLGTNGREGGCLRLETCTFKPCHIICQLGSGLDSVDGVKAVFFKTNFWA